MSAEHSHGPVGGIGGARNHQMYDGYPAGGLVGSHMKSHTSKLNNPYTSELINYTLLKNNQKSYRTHQFMGVCDPFDNTLMYEKASE